MSHLPKRFPVSPKHLPPVQLELPFEVPSEKAMSPCEKRPVFKVIQGGGERRQESLASREAVVRLLVETGADLLLRRISHERAEHIQNEVDRILALFDRVDQNPALLPVLEKSLSGLETLMTETRKGRRLSR